MGSATLGLTSSYDGDRRRLTSGTSSTFPFPAPVVGSTSYTANALNQYTAAGSVAPTYDKAGNLKNDGSFGYAYDTEGHLVLALGQGHRVTFDWDAEGRLATTTLDGTSTSYDYNGTTPMGDWTGTAFATGQTQSRRHVFGAGGEPLYLSVNGVATYSHQDILGSTVALSSATATPVGGLAASFNYDPFGQPIVPVTSAFGYAGQRLEQTTGLVYDGARFYSPAWGRFYSPDPIGYAGGNNLYAYVGNDPLNNTDPSGLSAQQVGSSEWNLTTALSNQFEIDQLNIQLTNARLTGNQNEVSRLLAQIDNLTNASGPFTGNVAQGSGRQAGPGTWTAANESMSARAAAYQAQITGRNGSAYIVGGVRFDGFDAIEGLLEAKGPGYASFVKNGEFRTWFRGRFSLIDQAVRQIEASPGTPITWHVAEPKAATAIENLLQGAGVQGINIVHTPVSP